MSNWIPKTCEECGKTLKNAIGYSGHMRSHRKNKTVELVSNPQRANEGIQLPTISSQLDRVVSILGSLSGRLDKLENPGFKGPEPKKEDTIVQNLQTTLEINKEVKQVDVIENPKCAYGLHYPSDFGQKAFFDGQGKAIPGKFTPAKTRCMPATPEIRKIIDEVLTHEFDVDILPDPASATFLLNIIVPPKYCIREEFRYGGIKDLRAKVINNFNSSAEVKAYALKVKDRVYKDHMAAQLPSPFTIGSMREGADTSVQYTQKQVLV